MAPTGLGQAGSGVLRDAVIVAHGAPADPLPQETAMQALARAVAVHRPGWTVRGATLAAPGALEAALAGLTAPLVYPFFMAAGWFTGTELPRRLAATGAADTRLLPPFGTDPRMPALAARAAAEGAAATGRVPRRTTLLIAAHGSQRAPASSGAATALAATLGARGDFARVVVGFIEQAPRLVDAAQNLGPAICLPVFALRAGHVVGDVPEALREAGFDGPVLPPLGAHPDVPAVIAAALAEADAATPTGTAPA